MMEEPNDPNWLKITRSPHQYDRKKRGNEDNDSDDSCCHASSAKRFRTTNDVNEDTFSHCNSRLKQNTTNELNHTHHADHLNHPFVPAAVHHRESNPMTSSYHPQHNFPPNNARCDDMTLKITRVNGDIPDHTLLVQRMASDGSYKYLPDLDASENPHYYENNRLLFELYVERIRRSSHGHVHPQSSHHF